MEKRGILDFRRLRANYKEIFSAGFRLLGERFPEAALCNLLLLVYQGGMLWTYKVEAFDRSWLIWTMRLVVLLLVAVAAELWLERRLKWQPGRYRWKIWCMLAVWSLVFEAGRQLLQGGEEALFYLACPLFWSCLIFYLLLPQDRERQSAQLRSGMNALISGGVIGMLISLLLGICLAAVQILLTDVPLELRLFVLGVMPCVCAINVCLCLLPKVQDNCGPADSSLMQVIMKLVLPSYVFLLLILYLYIGKIILQQVMPIGEMNKYASLALLGYGFFYFFWNDMPKPWFARFMRWGLIWFLPILLVQSYGVWVRYDAYGLTTLRYLSMICTAYGVLFLAFRFLRQGIRPLLLTAAVLVVVFSISPLNVLRVPLHDQQNRLVRLLAQEGMYENGRIALTHPVSAQNAAAVKSCVDYIRGFGADDREEICRQVKATEWRPYLPGKNAVKELPPKQPEYRLVFRPSRTGIPVAGCQLIYPFGIKNFMATIPLEEGKQRRIDLRDYLTNLAAAKADVPWEKTKFAQRQEKHITLDEPYVLDAQTMLYFTELEIWQDEAGSLVRGNGRGYLLKK